jgi:hypothetical protein
LAILSQGDKKMNIKQIAQITSDLASTDALNEQTEHLFDAVVEAVENGTPLTATMHFNTLVEVTDCNLESLLEGSDPPKTSKQNPPRARKGYKMVFNPLWGKWEETPIPPEDLFKDLFKDLGKVKVESEDYLTEQPVPPPGGRGYWGDEEVPSDPVASIDPPASGNESAVTISGGDGGYSISWRPEDSNFEWSLATGKRDGEPGDEHNWQVSRRGRGGLEYEDRQYKFPDIDSAGTFRIGGRYWFGDKK